MTSIRETLHAIRGVVARAVVRASRDDRATQLVDVTVREGHERTAVEVLQPFGFASRPADGLVVLLAVGGDQSDLVALPVAAPGARLGHLELGEAAIYGADASRVHVKRDGTVDVRAATAVDIATPGEGGSRVRLTRDGTIEVSAETQVRVVTPAGEMEFGAGGVRAALGEDVEIELTEARAKVRHGAQQVSASGASARLAAGGQFIAATAAGLVASTTITIGADPDPDV